MNAIEWLLDSGEPLAVMRDLTDAAADERRTRPCGRCELAAFQDQVGSDVGLGGWQSDAFIAHSSEWQLAAPVVGAAVLYAAPRSMDPSMNRRRRGQ